MTNSNVETRAEANSDELAAAQAASESVAYFLDCLIRQRYNDKGLRERVASLVKGFNDGTVNIKAEIVMAADGIVSFEFLQLRAGMPPKLIFDCVPSRKLNS